MTITRVDALIEAAEVEFADAGIESGSLRRIMRRAGADPGSIHYHFGGREELATAVLARILAPLNERRGELLDDAISAGEELTPTRLVEALIRPDIEVATELHDRSAGRARLLAAIYLRPAQFVETAVAAAFAPVAERFQPHLESALAPISFSVIAWRVRWIVFGTVGALLAHDTAAFDQQSDDLIAELSTTLAAALAA